MEGRPPDFDSDDELDFDFEAIRRRRSERETGERPLEGPLTEDQADADYDEEDASTTGERPAARRLGAGLRLPFGRSRRARERERRRSGDTGERDLPAFDTGEPDVPAGDTGERPIAGDIGERPIASGDTGERRLRDDPYTPAEVPVPGGRRGRHRDLPAKIRRRQAIGIGVVAVAVLGGGFLALAGGGDDEDEPLALKRLAGQTIVTRLDEKPPSQQLLTRARKGQIGGVIVAPSKATIDEATAQQSIAQLQQAAAAGGNPPLLVMVDQEGGEVKRLPGPPEASPADLGREGDPEPARSAGEETGAYLKSLGIDVDLAPVLDVELPQTADTIADRTFDDDAGEVATLGTAFIEGLQSQGVAATAKHFPGLGPATINTDFSPVSVVATQEEFDAAMEPFRAAVESGVQLVMMSSAAYPSLAGATPGNGKVKPAVFVEPIVQGLLRQQLGFEGVIITDDLESIAIKELSNRDVAAVNALSAGCDLMLYARSERGAVQGFNKVIEATKRGTLSRERLDQSYARITALKQALSSG